MNSIAAGSLRSSNALATNRHDLLIAGCQVNPVVLKIRDNGPALLDGEFYRDTAAALLKQQSANSDGYELHHTAVNHGTQETTETLLPVKYVRHLIIMLISVAVLSFSLLCVGTYAWQQKQLAMQLEAELLLLKAAADD